MNPRRENLDMIFKAIGLRQPMDEDTQAYRLFNGFYEGLPRLVLDRYGPTLVVFNHGQPAEYQEVIDQITCFSLEHLDGIESVLLKERQLPDDQSRNGRIIAGDSLTDNVSEYGVLYALDLQMNQDASFYIDTRCLRRWLSDALAGKRLLNTFAYTGSLGVVAGSGGATQVVQTDLSEKFLALAKRSWDLNHLDRAKCTYLPGDFFRVTGQMRQEKRLFDCVILDPPFFSETEAGRIELENDTSRLINKVRPLVAHQGWLVVINNALYLSGADFMAELQALCASDFLCLEQIIKVPTDITGYLQTIVTPPPVDPAPFNHPTKIAILRVTRKDQRI